MTADSVRIRQTVVYSAPVGQETEDTDSDV